MAIGELGTTQAEQSCRGGHVAVAVRQGFFEQLGFQLAQVQRAFASHAEALQPK